MRILILSILVFAIIAAVLSKPMDSGRHVRDASSEEESSDITGKKGDHADEKSNDQRANGLHEGAEAGEKSKNPNNTGSGPASEDPTKYQNEREGSAKKIVKRDVPQLGKDGH